MTTRAALGWQQAWQPVIDAVGTDFGADTEIAGPDAVELGAIRKYLEPLEFGCPLHHDADTARQQGYRDVIAPVTSAMSFTILPVWRPGEHASFVSAERNSQPARTGTGPRWTGLEPPTSAHFAAEASADYLAPVVLGDRLYRRGNRLVACLPKQTSVGRGAFSTWESEVHNQDGKVVARLRNTAYSYLPSPVDRSREPTARADRPAHPASMTGLDQGPTEDAPAQNSLPDWNTQRYWEDVGAGDVLSPVRFPLTVYRLVMAAGANRDFNSIHHNTEWAQSTGAPEMYANVLFLQGMWERCVREYIGLRGTIRSLEGFRMKSFNTVGDTVSVQGRIERTWQDGGTGFAQLQLWSVNRHGVCVGPGSVTVTLPRRAYGDP